MVFEFYCTGCSNNKQPQSRKKIANQKNKKQQENNARTQSHLMQSIDSKGVFHFDFAFHSNLSVSALLRFRIK